MAATPVLIQGLSDTLALASSLVQPYKIACPFTTVVNRAQIVDPSKDLLPRQGVSRVAMLDLQEVQGEFGPSGQQVFKPLNDTLDYVRLVGNWFKGTPATNGQFIASLTNGDYIEITFYGTGLNILCLANGNSADYRASIDGGVESATFMPANLSADYNSRNTNGNIICNVTQGLVLGTHTVRIRLFAAATINLNLTGYEVLTASGTSPNILQLQPGTSLVSGKKLAKAAASVDSYNSNFESGTLGTRGGHVVVYQKADGSVAKAVQPTDSSQLNFPSANHVNETLVRSYPIREFGAGRTDDWSFNIGVGFGQAMAFTLDDGTTSLVSTGGRDIGVGINGLQFQNSVAGKNMYFTFIGTGLDVLFTTDGSNRPTGLFIVDGTQVSTGTTITASTTQTVKIVSGLPYGTHTVRFASDGGGLDSAVFCRFMVYGPSKPSVPSGGVEIADYYVMANFTSNATPAAHIPSTGVIRKMPTRELQLVGGGWVPSLDITQSSGFQVGTGGGGQNASLIFYGTAVEWRNHVINGAAHNATLTVFSYATNANVSLTGISTFTTTATGGSSTYTASTGNVVVTGITGAGDEMVSVNSLPVGLYKVTLTYNSGAAGAVFVDSFDFATPIHSPKTNIPGNFQNELSVGNNGIGDSRVFSSLTAKSLNNWAQGSPASTSTVTTTSTSLIPAADMGITVKTNGNPLEISYSVNLSNNSTGVGTFVQVAVDGVFVGTIREFDQPASSGGLFLLVADSFILPVGAGVHTVQLFWAVTSGTGNLLNNRRGIKAREI